MDSIHSLEIACAVCDMHLMYAHTHIIVFSEAMNESEVFGKFYADLRKKVHPNDIAAELRTKHLTTENEHGEITNIMLPAKVRMDHLLSAVEKAIHIKAENFHIFLDVLANADRKYSVLVKQMKASLQGRPSTLH